MRVALIDGPLDPDEAGVETRVCLRAPTPGGPAALHAAALAAAVRHGMPEARILNLVVFGASLSTDIGCIARALAHAADLRADIVLCAFGMPRRDAGIAEAVGRVLQGEALIVAAAAARDGPVYPAALTGAVAVQGDARCGWGEWSLLAPHPLFGASPSIPGHPAVRGASAAAGTFAGLLAGRMAECGRAKAVDEMKAAARYRGPERRHAGGPLPCPPP